MEALKTGKIGINVKPREKGRNNVYQQLPTLLDVTCCVRLHNLLRVVGSFCAKFETSQTFEPTTPNISFVPWSPKRSATMLHRFAQLFQHCWGHARALHMVYNVLRVVTFPRCTADPNIIGSCFVHLHTTANTNATTSDIVGPTLLGVVASVYTSPLVLGLQILARLYQRCLTSCHLRLLHTRQQFAATRCSDTRQPQISVVENFCENLCLRNRILSP